MSKKELKFDVKLNLNTNSVFWSDYQDWLKHIPKESIDIIYTDPLLEKEREYYKKLYKESVKGSKQEKHRFDHVS